MVRVCKNTCTELQIDARAMIGVAFPVLVMLMCVFTRPRQTSICQNQISELRLWSQLPMRDIWTFVRSWCLADICWDTKGPSRKLSKGSANKSAVKQTTVCWFADVCWKIYSPWSAIQIVEVLGWLLKGAFWGQNWIHHLSTFAHILDRHCFPALQCVSRFKDQQVSRD